jgi:hypothetical protein
MSQYVAPAANLSDRDVPLLIDQKLWTLIDQLYGYSRTLLALGDAPEEKSSCATREPVRGPIRATTTA